jgi:hypothetical protein
LLVLHGFHSSVLAPTPGPCSSLPQPLFYLIFTSPEVGLTRLPVLNSAVSLLTRINFAERVMLARTGVNMPMDAVHSREICAEIGDRLREILRREASELPPRLQYLMERLAEADRETSPSLAPSLEDMIRQEPPNLRHESFDEQVA